MRKLLATTAAVTVLLSVAAAGVAVAEKVYNIPTIVKIAGIQWFNRMDTGVKKFATDTGNNSYEVGPAKADAQLQVQLVEDMIAKKADAITVVPFSPEALEPVLEKARAAGIKVVTHEASNIKNADWDLEAFQNVDYGKHQMDLLAECMHGEGQYAVFVGSLTSKTHNEWVDGAIAEQKAKYPKMELVGDRNETYDDQQKAYAKTQELLRKYPNLKGFKGKRVDRRRRHRPRHRGAQSAGQDLRGRHQPAVDRRPISGERRSQGDQLLGSRGRRLPDAEGRRDAAQGRADQRRHGSRH